MHSLHRLTWAGALLLVGALAACDCNSEPAATAPVREQSSAGEPAEAPESAGVEQAPEPAEPPGEDVAGLRLHRLDDGRIELYGEDRWGGSLDTTYESKEYLVNALPVLERSTTSEQAEALRQYVDQLPD